jgi:hypothetical protein
LRRRAARIARPARVRIRWRKPWVRLRRRLLGWNVRLLTGGLPVVSSKSERRWLLRPVDAPHPDDAGSAGIAVGRRPSNGTGEGQVGQTGGRGRIVQINHPIRPVDTPHDQRIFADGLHEASSVASVALRLKPSPVRVGSGLSRSAHSIHRVRRSPPALADRRTFCAHLWITVWSTSTERSTDARQPTAGVSRAESGPSEIGQPAPRFTAETE